MPTKSFLVENVALLPKSASVAAAQLNTITNFFAYSQAKEQRGRPTFQKVFSEPEIFVQQWHGSLLAVNTSYYNTKTDLNKPYQKVFQEPETFIQPQKGSAVVLVATQQVAQGSFLKNVSTVFVENVSRVQQQRGTLLVLAQPQVITGSGDVFSGHDTYGWPPQEEYSPIFVQAQQGHRIVLDSFPTYNVGNDMRILTQSKWFTDPESFIQAARGWFGGGPAQNFAFYNPGTDVRRQGYAYAWSEPEVFAKAFLSNPLILNGIAAPLAPVPNVIGLQEPQAMVILNAASFINVGVSLIFDTITPAGIVVAQQPVPGTVYPYASLIILTVSAGPYVPPAPPLPTMKVTTRQFSLEEMVAREWGASFRAPDHRIYNFTGRSFDSTDIGTTGIYQKGTRTS